MLRLSDRKLKRCKGIVVWDFDRVLFDTDRLIRDRKRVMQRHGVSEENIKRAHIFMTNLVARSAKRPFSTTFFLENLKKDGARFKEKVLRNDFRKLLIRYQYLDHNADRILHRLRKYNFMHILVSWGSAPYQSRKIKTACGVSFLRHFTQIVVTKKPKYFIIKKIIRRFPKIPAFFVDDSEEHIRLVKINLPQVVSIQFTKQKSLQVVEQEIMRRAK